MFSLCNLLLSDTFMCFLIIFVAQDDYQLVRDSISGYIFDSSPVDFTSDLGVRFVLHPTVLKISHPPRFASWIANGIASGLDALFLSRFESQRAEYWKILYSTIVSGQKCINFFAVFFFGYTLLNNLLIKLYSLVEKAGSISHFMLRNR